MGSFRILLAPVLAWLLLFPAALGSDASPRDLLAAGRADEAIRTLQARLNSNPKDGESYHLLSRAYYAVQDWDHAVANGEKAVALDPNKSEYHLWLGRAYGEKADNSSWWTAAGLAKKVRTEFERAVELSPNSVDARSDLAEFYLEASGIVGGGLDKARAQAATLAQLDSAKAHWVNARIAEKSKDTAVAEREYRASLEAGKNQADGWLNLALFYRRAGRLDDMEAAIAKATSAEVKKSDVLVDAAQTLLRAGRDFPAAIQLLRRYISSGRTVEDAPVFKAHYLLGTLLEKQGDKQGAATEYRAALDLAQGFSAAQQALKRVSR